MKKGFTLIEILFVVVIIALIVSFAVPALRSVRHDVRNSQAKDALKKLAEARRSFYQTTKGSDIQVTTFTGADTKNWTNSSSCTTATSSGIPGTRTYYHANQLFYCGYLDAKDFASLPYTFHICPRNGGGSSPCVLPPTGDYALEGGGVSNQVVSVAAEGNSSLAGKKYQEGNYFMVATKAGRVYDTKE